MKRCLQAGFLLLPLFIFILLSSFLILLGSQDLSQSYLHHQLQLHQNCLLLIDQLGNQDPQTCPPNPLATDAADD